MLVIKVIREKDLQFLIKGSFILLTQDGKICYLEIYEINETVIMRKQSLSPQGNVIINSQDNCTKKK